VRRYSRIVLARSLAALSCIALCGCFPKGPALEGTADPNVCDQSFDDHTHVGAIDVATFERMLETPLDARPQSVDFIVVWVGDAERRQVRFEEGGFYAFHDQWYWFRLMNGVSACGSSATPVSGHAFATVAEIEASFKGKATLPLDLERTSDGRVVSPSFYTLSLRVTPRVYATGTLFRFIDAGRADRWAFELEFVDEVKVADLHAIHATLEAALPAGSELFWRTVSPAQGALGTKLQQDPVEPLRARVLRLGEEPP
jgi:hypothetical protein